MDEIEFDNILHWTLVSNPGRFCAPSKDRILEMIHDAMPFGCEIAEIEESLKRLDVSGSEESNPSGNHWLVFGPGHDLPPNLGLMIGVQNEWIGNGVAAVIPHCSINSTNEK